MPKGYQYKRVACGRCKILMDQKWTKRFHGVRDKLPLPNGGPMRYMDGVVHTCIQCYATVTTDHTAPYVVVECVKCKREVETHDKTIKDFDAFVCGICKAGGNPDDGKVVKWKGHCSMCQTDFKYEVSSATPTLPKDCPDCKISIFWLRDKD